MCNGWLDVSWAGGMFLVDACDSSNLKWCCLVSRRSMRMGMPASKLVGCTAGRGHTVDPVERVLCHRRVGAGKKNLDSRKLGVLHSIAV
jgi:hypothetical protein